TEASVRSSELMAHREKLVLLPPNRVWRTYPGGATLDRHSGSAAPKDSHLAEDWIGSVTRSRIPGREELYEGVSQVIVGGESHDFRKLIDSDAAYFLGEAHVARHGAEPMLLVKFLDSAIRLHFQCHPSREFAQKYLNSPSGKTEAYHILGVRDGVTEPYFYMGFQNPPAPPELRGWIETQDTAAMEQCFEKIPVSIGDTFLIPGGFPHALGEGVFMIEIQEPTDFAVRYEFERGGYVLPEAARFMGRGLDFGLSLINFDRIPRETIERDYRCRPRLLRDLGTGSLQNELIGAAQTQCFRVLKTLLAGPATKSEASFHIGIVTAGACTVSVGGETHQLRRYDKFFCPAGLALNYAPSPACEILECLPPV
ncbi:MAG TPA: class I mannose-6-phosphate isomerase, partial [Opitutaceae bacterium]|nr:class I mannose-6-phosphate isomerase [Opitutaceae bacterium]